MTSPIFLQVEPNGVTMTIPTAFVSYTGEALDHKIPLLRSQEALGKQALRVLRWFDNTTAQRVFTNIGPEQEYFLVDRRLAEQRPDLILTGRTLFGAPSPKGQELEDQYFGSIRERILAFMMDLDRELWRLGIPAKTRHNEVAPGQFEMAPVYEPTSVGSDHNMVVMSMMRRLAPRHGLMFLIHEKPFAGINGSGKHNNWSMGTDEGENLLDPGNDPHANAQFLAFLVAVIRAVNVHADLLRASIADAGQDHRLGANEAPPAIMSIFLGSQLDGRRRAARQGRDVGLQEGRLGRPRGHLAAGPARRTPPTATGPRRSPSPATSSSSGRSARRPRSTGRRPCSTRSSPTRSSSSPTSSRSSKHGDFAGLTATLSAIVGANQQVLFEGNGYSEEWHAEAARRGLPNNRTTVDALPSLTTDKAKKLFSNFGVLSERELASRVEINWERYVKVQNIEANCALDIASTMILPATAKYLGHAQRRLVVARHQRGLPAGLRPGRQARRRDRRARARPAQGPRGRLGPQGGARLLRRGHPGPDRPAGGRRRARDARGRRALAAPEVPRAALPVLS